MGIATWLIKQNVINHAPTAGAIARYTQILIQRKISRTHVMNKLNKKAILSMRTADICYHLVLCWRKTPVFGITWKTLIISMIVVFNVNKNKNHFQEAAFLEAKSAAYCRWNRCFLHQELPFFERKNAKWGCFHLSSVFKDTVLCHADLANHCFLFSISLKVAKVNFIYIY